MKSLYHSHRDDTHQGGEAPTEPHMGLLVAQGEILPIPVGAHLFFISDPRRVDGVVECILEKVVFENHVLKEVRLVAYTRNTNSTRKLRLRVTAEGEYKSAIQTENDNHDSK